MRNYDELVEINHNPNWSYIPDHLYRILIISGSGKTNVLLNLEKRVLIVFDDMIADTESNTKLSPIVTELFLKGTKFNISLVFIS